MVACERTCLFYLLFLHRVPTRGCNCSSSSRKNVWSQAQPQQKKAPRNIALLGEVKPQTSPVTNDGVLTELKDTAFQGSCSSLEIFLEAIRGVQQKILATIQKKSRRIEHNQSLIKK